jgi:ABC-type Fe3+-hydroxamate transport system substrate-binding protein
MIEGCRYAVLSLVLARLAAPATGGVSARDDTGVRVALPHAARRVVSLAPSTTEMLFAIGAAGTLVGVSAADDFPPAARRLPKIGSYSGPDLERIIAAQPDLIVVSYGNPQELVGLLRRRHLPVYVSNPATVSEMMRNLIDLGSLTGHSTQARRVVRNMEERLRRVEQRVSRQPPVRTLVVIWDEPLTVAGGKSFIQDILRRAGGVNAAASFSEAYPKLDPERLLVMDPEVVLFPVAPVENSLDRLKSHAGFRQTRAVRSGRVYALNPDWVERAGPRLVLGVEAVARLLHPSPHAHQASK